MDASLGRRLRIHAKLPAATRISRKNQITLPVAVLQFVGRLPMAATGDALVDDLRGEVEGE